MMAKKTVTLGVASLMFLTLLVAFVPTASAQGENKLSVKSAGTPTVGDAQYAKSGRLAPEIGQVEVTFKWKVTVPPLIACPSQAIVLGFVPEKKMLWSDQATAILSQSQIVFFHDSQNTGASPKDYPATGEFETKMTIKVTKNVPAFQPGEYAVTATARPGAQTTGGCTLTASDPQRVPVTITNDYVAIMEYQPAKYIQKTGQNKEVVFVVKMTNFGNAQSKVTAETVQTSSNKLDVVTPPSQITLDSRAELGDKATYFKDATITARTPHSNGYTNSLYAFTATFKATAVQTGVEIQTDTQTLTLSVQVQGVYVPGFDASSLIAALGLGLVLLGFARRRVD